MQYSSTPQLRLSSVNLLTDLGWCSGTLHVPGRQSLVDFLAGSQTVKVTRVRVPDEAERLPFVGFRRDAILMVEPTQSDELLEAGSVGRTSSHRVGCLLGEGILHGTLDVLVNVRVSDFLRQQPGLAVLRDCSLAPYGQPSDSNQARRMRSALVNLSRVAGVVEWLNQQV
ncbi:MAG TPA: hypothetical protein VH764_13055 [Gemmatimonadales bacterium]|jgi:hypothetical protein